MLQMNPSVVCAHHYIHMCSPKKSFACGHVHFFFCTAAHLHFAGRYSISHFLTAAKKVFMLFFFSTKSVSLVFSSRFSQLLLGYPRQCMQTQLCSLIHTKSPVGQAITKTRGRLNAKCYPGLQVNNGRRTIWTDGQTVT